MIVLIMEYGLNVVYFIVKYEENRRIFYVFDSWLEMIIYIML